MAKPKWKVTGLKIRREGDKFKATWSVPKAALKSNDSARFTELQIHWRLDYSGTGKDVNDKEKKANEKATSDTHSLSEFGTSRAKLAHSGKGKNVDSVMVRVRGVHVQNGRKEHGDWTAWAKYSFSKPKAPKLSLSYDDETRRVSLTVKSYPTDTGHAEWYDTMYQVVIFKTNGKTSTLQKWTSTERESQSWSHNINSYMSNFQSGKYVKVVAYAISYGLGGGAAAATKSIAIGMANAATIKSVKTSSKKVTGKIQVKVKPGARTVTVQLYRRKNDEQRVAVGKETKVGGASTVYLLDSVGDIDGGLKPGDKIYYQIGSKGRETTEEFSAEFYAKCLYTAPAEGAQGTDAWIAPCAIVSAEPSGATGINAVIGWNESDGSRDGNELSWATDVDAWRSNVAPDTLDVTWSDDDAGSDDYDETATCHIRGLTEGETYYLRARTYAQDETDTLWSGYSESVAVDVFTRPDSVTVTAPDYVERGKSIEVYWTVGSELPQARYSVDAADSSWSTAGEGSLSYALLSADLYDQDEDATAAQFTVSAGTGGELCESEAVTVGIVDAPICAAVAPATLTAQPAAVSVTVDEPSATLLCTLRSEGVGDQVQGEVVWTAQIAPEWTENANGTYTAAVEAPVGTRLIDGGDYEFSVVAVEPLLGLRSETAQAAFTVNWAHKAPLPSQSIRVTPLASSRSAVIALQPPSGAEEGDVYDVYRKSGDGWDLIASGAPLNGRVTDPYAPFGSMAQLAYRVETRTADGDTEPDEFSYQMPVDVMRLDWGTDSVEVAYNMDVSESYEKGFEARRHSDGTATGRWDGTVSRSRDTNALVVRRDSATLAALQSVANHAGPVFARLPNGRAYTCNADISPAESYDSGTVEVSVSMTAVTLSPDHMGRIEEEG